MLELVTRGMMDRSARSTLVTVTTGMMESGVMQTSIPAQMPITIQHKETIMSPAMEPAKLLVAQVNMYIYLS